MLLSIVRSMSSHQVSPLTAGGGRNDVTFACLFSVITLKNAHIFLAKSDAKLTAALPLAWAHAIRKWKDIDKHTLE